VLPPGGHAAGTPAVHDRLFNVTLPPASPGILVGGIVAYATCLGEFGAVITFAAKIPGQTQTLPLRLSPAARPQHRLNHPSRHIRRRNRTRKFKQVQPEQRQDPPDDHVGQEDQSAAR
jgi:hypothetical protein